MYIYYYLSVSKHRINPGKIKVAELGKHVGKTHYKTLHKDVVWTALIVEN